ncbi:MAG: ATP-binding cassette domain-containing protein [Trebonia sp.]
MATNNSDSGVSDAAAGSRRPAIEASALRKSFGVTVALDGVDLVAKAGQVLALLGPNGAGKTTLVRILATLLSADAGTARVGGYDVASQAGRVRALIGVTGQFAAVDDLLTGRENLEMVAELCHFGRREANRRAWDLLERFGLVDAADRRAGTYSGGMRRRLDLAASLVARPAVVFLDEPTTGLDPGSRRALWAAVKDLADAGTTVLLTTQYLEEADRLAGRIAVIDRGRIIADGSASELKSRLGGDVVELEAGERAVLDSALAALGDLAGGQARVDRQANRLAFPAPAGPATLMAALRRLDEAQVVVDDIGIRRPSLDDVFLSLTGHHSADIAAPAIASPGTRS